MHGLLLGVLSSRLNEVINIAVIPRDLLVLTLYQHFARKETDKKTETLFYI